jgi:hypothetical protein
VFLLSSRATRAVLLLNQQQTLRRVELMLEKEWICLCPETDFEALRA